MPVRWVAVQAFDNPLTAHIVCGFLESEGVPARLASEHHVWLNNLQSLALGGIRREVPEEQSARAADLLRRRDEGEFDEGGPGTPAP